MGIISSTIACGVFADPEWENVSRSSGFIFAVDTNSVTNVSEVGYRQNKQFCQKGGTRSTFARNRYFNQT